MNINFEFGSDKPLATAFQTQAIQGMIIQDKDIVRVFAVVRATGLDDRTRHAGAISLSSSRNVPPIEYSKLMNPVMLPPGRPDQGSA